MAVLIAAVVRVVSLLVPLTYVLPEGVFWAWMRRQPFDESDTMIQQGAARL